MTLRAGHGRGAGVPRVEVLPVDEAPVGVPGDARPASPDDRVERGLFARGNALASAGGRARAGHTRLARKLRLGESFADPAFEPYARAAVAFRRAQVATLAATVGGGVCGPAPSSMVASAALQLAASRYAFEVLGDMVQGSRLANDSRQNLLGAHELCAKEAQSRKAAAPPAWRALLGLDQSAASTVPAAVSHAPAETVSGPGGRVGASGDETASQGRPETTTKETTR